MTYQIFARFMLRRSSLTNRSSALEFADRQCNLPPALPRLSQRQDIGGEIGKLALGQRNRRHRMLRHHDMRHDRAGALAFFVGNLAEARDVGIGLLLVAGADQMTIRAKVCCQLFTIFGIWRLVAGAADACAIPSGNANPRMTIIRLPMANPPPGAALIYKCLKHGPTGG
jgi:hypothetical protein